MPEDNGTNGAAAEATPVATAPAPEPFSAHEAVENVFSNLNRSPRPESSRTSATSDPKNDTPLVENAPHTVQAQAPPSEPSAPAINWEKRYNDLQSDYDRRAKNEASKVEEKLRGEMQQLAQAVLQQQRIQQQSSTQPADGDYDRPMTRAEAMQYAAQAAEQIVQQRLASDPRLQVAGHIGDWARYREERQDSTKYDPFVTKLLSKFPVPQGGNLHQHLNSAYEFFAELEAEAQAMQANKQGEAARGNTPPPQQVHPNSQNQQAAALMERAARYRMEQGVAPTAATRPAIDTFGNEEEAIDAMVTAWMRGRR